MRYAYKETFADSQCLRLRQRRAKEENTIELWQTNKSTTFNRQEVEAVLNYATEIARDIVANGDIVDFGDLGTLKPSFKSKAVPQGEKFNANVHIEKPVVLLNPSRKYFTLTDVSYEQTTMPEKKTKTNGGGSVHP